MLIQIKNTPAKNRSNRSSIERFTASPNVDIMNQMNHMQSIIEGPESSMQTVSPKNYN